jgi:hypothetical protein
MYIDIIKINDRIVPIKINTAMKEKTTIKNVSLGSVVFSINSIDEFIFDDNHLLIHRP